ncbi:hypothetical protein CR513_18877, partial [Mucuna pruriens]
MKGSVEVRGIVSEHNKHCQRNAKISEFSLFHAALVTVPLSMPTSIYKSLNFGDLEPTRMTIQLENRSVVQPLGILEDVLVQVNKLIFPADFYVLDMEDETSGKV